MNPLLETSDIRSAFPIDQRVRQQAIDFPDRRRTGLRLFLRRLWSLVAESDTTPTKFLLSLTATFWCVLLLLPGDSLSRPVYFYIAMLAGDHPDEKWAAAWGLYAVAMWWKVFSAPGKARWIPTLINIFGLVLYSIIPICFFMQRLYPFPVGSGPYVALAMAAGWVAVRTHINPVRGWRGD